MEAVIFCENMIDPSNITRCINLQVFVYYRLISQCGTKKSLEYITTLKNISHATGNHREKIYRVCSVQLVIGSADIS
jgi:hypothetical protein